MSYPPPPGSDGPTGPPPPPPYQFSPQPPAAGSSKAVISLVLGILSLVMCGLFLGIPAMVLARQAKREIRESHGAVGGEGLATAGFVTGLLGTLWSLLLVVLLIGLLAVGGPIFNEFQESCVTTQAPDGSFSVECN